MDYSFFVALNRPAADCDAVALVGDQFSISVIVYEADGDEDVADLTGDTAALEVMREGAVEFTLAGTVADGVATFDLGGVDLSDIVGRNTLRVKLVRDGRATTVIDGALTVSE